MTKEQKIAQLMTILATDANVVAIIRHIVNNAIADVDESKIDEILELFQE